MSWVEISPSTRISKCNLDFSTTGFDNTKETFREIGKSDGCYIIKPTPKKWCKESPSNFSFHNNSHQIGQGKPSILFLPYFWHLF